MSRFGSRTTALDVVRDVDLTGRVAVITGGNSGIGAETARAFAEAGATVFLTSRDPGAEKGKAKAHEIAASGVKGKVDAIHLDLSDLASIEACARELQQVIPERGIDYLICNAGVMACPYKLTPAGFEWQIGVNVFGHFSLVKHLERSLQSQTAACRIVFLASNAEGFGELDLDDLHFKRRKYSAWKAYGQSKLADIMLTKAFSDRYAGTNIEVFSVHPGVIFSNLWRHSYFGYFAIIFGYAFTKSPQQGAATGVYAAIEPSLKGKSGANLADCHIQSPQKGEAENMQLCKKLYDIIDQQLNQASLELSSNVGQQIHS